MELNVEQLVYGSFSFREGGYDLLARSPGCSTGLTAEVVAVCRRFGQPPSSDAARPGLFAVRLPGGPWAVVKVVPQGVDDRGRPGALAFHALIVASRDYRRAGANPFAFEAASRVDWSQTPADLPRIRVAVEPTPAPGGPASSPRVERIVAALTRRQRVAVEAAGPIDDLAREVWARLPARVRRRRSVATWAFAGENRFDLVAFPRLVGVALDASYVLPATLDAPATASKPDQPRWKVPARGMGLIAVGLLILALAAPLAWWGIGPGPAPAGSRPTETRADPTDSPLPPAEAARVESGLAALAARFEAGDVGPASDPARLLNQLNDAYHYRGRLLTAAELDLIRRDPDPDKVRALAWHDQIRRFLPDVSWPGDFASLPLPRQLAAVARAFHLDPGLPPAAVPAALIAALARPGLIRPTPLAARFPALSDYARFLGKLPRADDPAGSEMGR